MKLTFHVPTQQYGFLEIEGNPDETEIMEKLYNQYAETPVSFKKGNRKLLKAWVGGEVYYDENAHQYTNEAGDVYLSGSTYADSFKAPFDTLAITKKMAEKSGVAQDDIIKMWEMKRDISNGLGTAIHAALELYGKYNGLAEKIGKDYSQHDHPVIKQAVDEFFKNHKEQSLYEVLVVDHARKYAGQIDRLTKDKDSYYVEDFKTNADMPKDKLNGYWNQLSFYASIIEAGGKKVAGLRIHHWKGTEWTTYESPVLEVK
jgi:hypothetical protein